jgi:Uma2 family endonuclease
MVAQPLYTFEEYLAAERKAEERHEYLDGYIYAMAGESPAHADISSNLVALVHGQLRGSPCRVRRKDTKVRSGPDPRQRRSFKGLFPIPIWSSFVVSPNIMTITRTSSSTLPS